ncbi:hypothetical protein Hanom_Chr09g00799881 [Helianthus anomalus]
MGDFMEETTTAIASQAFIAEIVEEGFEEANVEELTVVAEALSKNLEMDKINEAEENKRGENEEEERRKKEEKKNEKKDENDRFEFKIATEEMQRFADEEMETMKAGKVENSDKAFMASIKRRLGQATIKNQDLKSELETCQNTVLEKNKIILDKDNLILDLHQKLEKFENSSDMMIFCINNLRLKDSEDGMLGVGYKKVPPLANHNFTSTPSIDPEIENFIPTAPLVVDPLGEEECESESESDSEQKSSSDAKTNEIDLSKIENLINSRILETLNQVQNVRKSKPNNIGKMNVKNI